MVKLSSDGHIPGRFVLLMLCPCYRSFGRHFEVFRVSSRPRKVTIHVFSCIKLDANVPLESKVVLRSTTYPSPCRTEQLKYLVWLASLIARSTSQYERPRPRARGIYKFIPVRNNMQAGAMHDKDVSALATRRPSALSPSDVPIHSPRSRSAGHTTLLSVGPRAV